MPGVHTSLQRLKEGSVWFTFSFWFCHRLKLGPVIFGKQTKVQKEPRENLATHPQSRQIQRRRPADSHMEQCTRSGKQKGGRSQPRPVTGACSPRAQLCARPSRDTEAGEAWALSRNREPSRKIKLNMKNARRTLLKTLISEGLRGLFPPASISSSGEQKQIKTKHNQLQSPY